MTRETTADDDRRTVYERDYVTLPPVEEGDEVRVRYEGQADSPQVRQGTVEEVHVNGFEFDDGRDGYRTGVREHNTWGLKRHVSTLKKKDDGSGYRHAADLNRDHRNPEEVEVEVVEGGSA
jgi:hypothetical protein